MSSGNTFFSEFLEDYFAESEEHLAAARHHLAAMEPAAREGRIDGQSVDELLRSFHSLKGLSAMVGFEEIAHVAHRLEDYLRSLREPDAAVQPEDLTQALYCVDAIDTVLDARRKHEPPPDLTTTLLTLDHLGSGSRAPAGESGRPPAGGEEAQPPAVPFPLAHRRFEFRPTPELSARGINVTTVRESLARIGKLVHSAPVVREGGGIAFEFVVETPADESAFEELQAQGITLSRTEEAKPPSGPESDERFGHAPQHLPLNLVRVDMRRLDDLLRLVGELVISRARLDETLDTVQKSIPPAEWRALEEVNLTMSRHLRDLREGIMRARMIPIGQAFERMRFVMRSLERETGKHIRLEVSGQETEIDKLVVERLMDPLLHLVRNAVSHGIESPSEREAAGKGREGLVRLRAFSSGEVVVLGIEDDGRGIDPDFVEKRARQQGLLQPHETLDSAGLLEMISTPGFSTREAADLTSGRGFGMSVVRSTVEDLGGSIALETVRGAGTRFTLRLPLTLAIADALLIECSGQRYVVPQSSIREVIPIESNSTVELENNEVISYRGAALPLVRLNRLFNLNGTRRDRLHVLVLDTSADRIGIVVDRIIGQREIVIRPIADPSLRIPGVVGATELGDGRPVLILDAHALIRARRR